MEMRKIALCVDLWWSEENHFAWTFLRKRLLEEAETPAFHDRIYVIHVTKGKEDEQWNRGTAVLGDAASELSSYDHSIVELQGDVVTSLVQFFSEEGIHFAILSLKDHSRVKKTLSIGTANQILSKASCSCIVVSPRLSAGDHFRLQANLQPDVLVANSAMQFRRRLAVVLNSSEWDSALLQYVAENVIVSKDRVILVRCLSENISKKQSEELQSERDYLRELGWHKFKRMEISLGVEVIQDKTKEICDLIEEKGIDLLIVIKSDSNLITRSIKKDAINFQAFPYKSPCPFMNVPTEVLRNSSALIQDTSALDTASSPFRHSTSLVQGFFSKQAWSSAFSHPHIRLFRSNNRRCMSMDGTDQNQNLRVTEYANGDDSIGLSSNTPLEVDVSGTGMVRQASDQTMARTVFAIDEESQKEATLKRLRRKLLQKEQEVMYLKQRILSLQQS